MAMKLTKQKLINIIQEELETVLAEAADAGMQSSEFRTQGIETQKAAAGGGVDAAERKAIQDMYGAMVAAAKATKLDQGRLGNLINMVFKELEAKGYTGVGPDAKPGAAGQKAKPAQ